MRASQFGPAQSCCGPLSISRCRSGGAGAARAGAGGGGKCRADRCSEAGAL